MANETILAPISLHNGITALSSTVVADAFNTAAGSTLVDFDNSTALTPFARIVMTATWLTTAPTAGGVVAFHIQRDNVQGTSDEPVPGVNGYTNRVAHVVVSNTLTQTLQSGIFELTDSDAILIWIENLTDQTINTTNFDLWIAPQTFGTA